MLLASEPTFGKKNNWKLEKRLLDEAAHWLPRNGNDGRQPAELSNIRVVVRVRPAQDKGASAASNVDNNSRWTAATASASRAL